MLNIKTAIVISAILALFLSSNLAYAANIATNQTLLVAAYQNAQCKTNFTIAYIKQVVFDVPTISGITQYSTVIEQQTNQLRVLANQDNLSTYRAYLSGTFDPELNQIAQNVSSQLKASNLDANQIAKLNINYNQTDGIYQNCYFSSMKNFAAQQLSIYNSSILNAKNVISNLSSKGVSTTLLTQLVQNAQNGIINPLRTGIAQSTNGSQIYVLLNEYCLFDGCANGTNFHFDANFQIRTITVEINYLELTSRANLTSLARTQTYLNSALSLQNAVGTSAYTAQQATGIFNNLDNASQMMRQTEARDLALQVISKENAVIGIYQIKTNTLATNGTNIANINLLLLQARQITSQQHSAINSGMNESQLRQFFLDTCIENDCVNGTNLHLTLRFQTEFFNASLQNAITLLNAHNPSTVNQSALRQEQGYLRNASSLIGLFGDSYYSQSQINQIAVNLYKFEQNLKSIRTQ